MFDVKGTSDWYSKSQKDLMTVINNNYEEMIGNQSKS